MDNSLFFNISLLCNICDIGLFFHPSSGQGITPSKRGPTPNLDPRRRLPISITVPNDIFINPGFCLDSSHAVGIVCEHGGSRGGSHFSNYRSGEDVHKGIRSLKSLRFSTFGFE